MSLGPIVIKNPEDVRRALVDRITRISFEDAEFMTCPRCGVLIPDYDGFGVLAHLKIESEKIENWPEGCGFCTHPASRTEEDGSEICELCEAKKNSPEWLNNCKP